MSWCRRKFFRPLICLVVVVTAACGYRLQSYDRLPPEMKLTYIQTSDTFSDFYRQLVRSLESAGATITSDPQAATAHFIISKDRTGQKLITVSGQNEPLEFEVFYRVSYSIRTGDDLWLTEKSIDATRSYTYDRTEVLGKRDEEQIIREALVRDLVRRVMRTISTAQNVTASE